jgi:cold shock CspA family protein
MLQEFPAQSPEAVNLQPSAVTDDENCEVIKASSEKTNGFIAQNAGAKLVQKHFPEVSRERARQLVKQVTRSDKPGPKGPRRSKSA